MCAIVRSGIAGVCVFGVASLGIAAAHADVELLGDPGVALTAGVGVEDFAGAGMRDATGIAGLWDVRVAIGTRSPIAGEVAYVGSASRIASMIGMEEGTLVSSGIEGLLRGNLYTDGAWQPYAFAGAGWRRYSVTGADVSTSDAGMNDSDDVLVLPFGLGCSYRHRGFLADARGTFRATTDQGLVLTDAYNTVFENYAVMHTWSVSARLGYEF